jgi:hypothetical protein
LYNLKDWIKKATQDEAIENLFNKNKGIQSLQIVSDFVTNIKHFDNSRSSRLHPETYFISRDAQAGGQGPAHTWWVQFGDEKRINAYNLVDDSYKAIKEFMYLKALIK